jgi:hypothetical protein
VDQQPHDVLPAELDHQADRLAVAAPARRSSTPRVQIRRYAEHQQLVCGLALQLELSRGRLP